MRSDFKSVEEYFDHLEEDKRAKLLEFWNLAKSTVPTATEKISYQMPTLYLKGNLVHCAAFSNHLGFYPGADALEAFKNELNGFRTSKGTIQLPYDSQLPHDLIKRVILFCLARNEKKSKK